MDSATAKNLCNLLAFPLKVGITDKFLMSRAGTAGIFNLLLFDMLSAKLLPESFDSIVRLLRAVTKPNPESKLFSQKEPTDKEESDMNKKVYLH